MMSEEFRSVIAWLAVWFLTLELAAHYQLARWQAGLALTAAAIVVVALWPVYTLSGTGWHAISWWSFVGILIAVFTMILLGHFEFHWGARYLIGFAVAAVAVIASHAIEQATR